VGEVRCFSRLCGAANLALLVESIDPTAMKGHAVARLQGTGSFMPRRSATAVTPQRTSVSKALDVLRAFIDHQHEWGVRELATAVQLPLSSTHWLLQILRGEGLVEWNPSRQKYRLGMELQRWGVALSTVSRRFELGRRSVQALLRATGLPAQFAVYDAPRQRVIHVAPGGARADGTPLGHAAALTEDAAGWAVLAALPASGRATALEGAAPAVIDLVKRAVRTGHVISPPSEETGATIAVAVQDMSGAPIGALCLTVPAERLRLSGRLAETLREEAAALSLRLGGRVLAGVRGTAPHLLASLVRPFVEQRPDLWVDEDADLNIADLLREVQEGRAGYCAAVLGWIEDAYCGVAPFAAPHDRLRLLSPLASLQLHVLVHRDAPFRHLRELLGTRVAAGEPGYVTSDLWHALIGLLAPGVAMRRKAEARLAAVDYGHANRMFIDGALDALVSLNAAPVPGYRDLARAVPVRLIGLDQALIRQFVAERASFSPGVIPAGIYDGVAEDVPTLATVLAVATSTLRSTAETRLVADAIGQRVADLPPWPASLGVPFHPGAPAATAEAAAVRPRRRRVG